MHPPQNKTRFNKTRFKKIGNGDTISEGFTRQDFSVELEDPALQDTLPLPAVAENAEPLETLSVPELERVALLETLSLPAVMENVVLLETLRLPAITLPTEPATQTGSQKLVARTAGSAALAGFGDLVFAVLRYLTNIVMTNLVSPSIFGIYTTVYTAANVVGFISVFGLDSTVVRFLPAYRVKGERGLIGGLLSFVIWTTLISGLLAGVFFYFSATTIAHVIYHQDGYAFPLQEGALLIPLFGLQLVLGNSLTALKAIKWKVYADRLLQPTLCLILMGVFYLLGLRLEALILATICSFLASVITEQLFLHKVSRPMVRGARNKFEPKIWSRFALPLFLNSLIQNILSSTDMLFLAAFATFAQVGLYAAADRAGLLVVIPYYSLNVIFPPLIAEYFARGEHKQLVSLSKTVTKWSFSLSWPIFLCFCVFHNPILSVFSREYVAGSAVLIIVSFGNLVDAGVGSVGSLLAMTGHARIYLINTIVAITVNIGLALLLVPRFNIVGAAVATTIAIIILNVAGFVEVYFILKIFLFRWDILKPILAGGVACMVGIPLLRIIHVGYGYGAILGTLGLVLPFMFVYIFALALLRLSKDDRIVLDAVLAKFGKKGNTNIAKVGK